MLEQLFAEIWSRDTLSMRDKRILLLGIIAEKGEATTFKLQIKASLKRGEINPDEAREFLLFIAQYSGYPRAAAMLGPVEEAIAEYSKENPQQ
jgi:4-carboxymuconolactone decarboxylase